MEKKRLLKAITFTVIGVISFLLAITRLTFAYFSANVRGNESANNIVATTGILRLLYTDGPEVRGTNIMPGWTGTKNFTVENTGNRAYNLFNSTCKCG